MHEALRRRPSLCATRDLVDPANLGALIRSGEGKYTRYRLALPLRENEAAFDFARES